MLPKLRFFLRQALFALGRSPGVTVLAVGTNGIALAVLATFALIVQNLARAAEELGREVELSAYLVPTTDPATGATLARIIEQWSEVRSARFLSSPAAMKEFRASLGKDALLLDGLPDDVLPPSVEVRLEERPWLASEVAALGARLERLEGVADVRFGQEDIERVHELLRFARIGSAILGVALCLATVLIVSNTIRLTVYARRDEIEIMSLVGASDLFVRAPFVFEGAIQGLLGGAVAFALLQALENVLEVGLERGLSYAFGPINLAVVPFELGTYLMTVGCALGLVGSLLAVGKFLRV